MIGPDLYGLPIVASEHVPRHQIFVLPENQHAWLRNSRVITMHPQDLLNWECRMIVRNGLLAAFPWLKL